MNTHNHAFEHVVDSSEALRRGDRNSAMPPDLEQRVKGTVRQFILRSINIPDLKDDDDLFEMGMANSLFAIQLMTFIEKTFALDVEVEDLDIQNFTSLNASTTFIIKKIGHQNAIKG